MTSTIDLLVARGAETIEHPGGTLLAHLRRVSALLAEWGARPALREAGLCHAFYGTDGFPVALLELTERDVLAKAAGPEAEALVYFYAACDRGFTYPALAEDGAVYRDRFTGERHAPSLQRRRDLAELTAANELDIARVSPEFRHRHGAGLLALFTRFRPLLGDAAWAACEAVLAPGASAGDVGEEAVPVGEEPL
ncbi:DUF6817 domain-containing protein [Sphaerisporangium sp. TRM90804]|uniref:DUF6817 domain-containing protein n=1 Tax=Sphaerisporangium sp. TRM90804 TaxID=3031113 RepID=UPI00244D319E|nr:hypothetical protein [Sphaerisporangium sp. TRM90804]MDH2426674.1 hypothetical protein [Sphaerisporangium sp. TRM90804]